MIPAYSTHGLDFGNCMQACVASMLDAVVTDVPHFAHDGADGMIIAERIRDYLLTQGLLMWVNAYPDDKCSLDAVLATQGASNPGILYMLMGSTATGEEHAVICCGDEIIHNPSPWPADIVSGSVGHYWVITFVPAMLAYA